MADNGTGGVVAPTADSAEAAHNAEVLNQLSKTDTTGESGAQQKLLDYLLGGAQ